MVATMDITYATGGGADIKTTSTASTDTSYVTVYTERYSKEDYDVDTFEDYEERRVDKQEKRYAAKNYKARVPKIFRRKQERRVKRFRQKIR